jgi:hypothetical protein
MNSRDPHTALKSEVVTKLNFGRGEAVIAQLQWGKTEIGYSLHVNPTQYSTSGLQITDYLAYLGFKRSAKCVFTNFDRCYSKYVEEGFDLNAFATALNAGYSFIEKAQGALESCGFFLPQPEGWGYFNGRQSGRSFEGPARLSGNGHTAMKVQNMKQTEDETFLFRFTFVDTGGEKRFVTHYRPKHPPLSPEIASVFRYLNLQLFPECPEFDFEQCHFRTLRFLTNGSGVFDSNTEAAHRAFDAHQGNFSRGVQLLLSSNAAAEEIGMGFLPIEKPAVRIQTEISASVKLAGVSATVSTGRTKTKVAVPPTATKLPNTFDVAISFAGTERASAESLADILRAAGFSIFYDNYYPEHLWGKNLTVFFDEIFRKRARFCVMFVSKEYQERKWTSHEARSAQARALEEKGNEYILPIRVDNTELEGLLPTVGYVPLATGIDKIADMLLKKLRAS